MYNRVSARFIVSLMSARWWWQICETVDCNRYSENHSCACPVQLPTVRKNRLSSYICLIRCVPSQNRQECSLHSFPGCIILQDERKWVAVDVARPVVWREASFWSIYIFQFSPCLLIKFFPPSLRFLLCTVFFSPPVNSSSCTEQKEEGNLHQRCHHDEHDRKSWWACQLRN